MRKTKYLKSNMNNSRLLEQTKTDRQGDIYRNALFTDRLQTELNAILSFYHY